MTMMHIHLCCIGKLKKGLEYEWLQRYQIRLHWTLVLHEFEEKKNLPVKELKESESRHLAAMVPAQSLIVALDETGTQFSSVELAQQFKQWESCGHKNLAFLIGGAHGLTVSIKEKAHSLLSLGRLTWPHMMTRVLLVEQIYRCQQILAGHPYHK